MYSQSQWSTHQPLHRECWQHSSHHKQDHGQDQWLAWDNPASFNNHSRFLPLISNDQRNVQSYFDGQHVSISPNLLDDPEPFDETFDISGFDDDLGMCQTSIDPAFLEPAASPELELVDGPGISIGIPEGFFLNPFAVSFPGDLPCPEPLSMASGMQSLPMFSMMEPLPDSPVLPTIKDNGDPVCPRSITPASTSSTPQSTKTTSIENNHNHARGITKTKTKATTTTTGPTSSYGNQIQFVDMADKKGAQRIRNTMNSRRHRQNKLDKIRELEKKLEALEAERDMWQGRATSAGSKEQVVAKV